MTWLDILKFWNELFKASGETQSTVAEKGGLSGQNVISKMTANRNMGPQVETFVKAVNGLGLTLSSFFAELERRSKKGDAVSVGSHQKEITKLLSPSSAAATKEANTEQREPVDVGRSLPDSGRAHPLTRADLRRLGLAHLRRAALERGDRRTAERDLADAYLAAARHPTDDRRPAKEVRKHLPHKPRRRA